MASSAGQKLVAGRIPGERIATETITSDSTTFTVTETQIASVTASVVSGRKYRVVFDGGVESTASGVIRGRLKEDDINGTVIQTRDVKVETAGSAFNLRLETEYTADATENKTFVVGGDTLSGGGTSNVNANTTAPSLFYVEYVEG